MVDKTMMGDKCAELVRAAMIGALAVTLSNPTAVYAAEEETADPGQIGIEIAGEAAVGAASFDVEENVAEPEEPQPDGTEDMPETQPDETKDEKGSEEKEDATNPEKPQDPDSGADAGTTEPSAAMAKPVFSSEQEAARTRENYSAWQLAEAEKVTISRMPWLFHTVEKTYAIADVNSWLHVREGKGTDQKIVGILPKGSLCYILADEDSDWVYVESGDVRGFVCARYLRRGEEAKTEVNRRREESFSLAEMWIKPWNNRAYTYTYATTKTLLSSGEACGGLLQYAKKFLGNPYVWGGTSLTNGCDCSGFAQQIFANFGYALPRTSRQQAKAGTRIPVREAKPGDLLFYQRESGFIYHVMIYLGDGKVIHAGSEATGILISDFNYEKSTEFAVRVIPEEMRDSKMEMGNVDKRQKEESSVENQTAENRNGGKESSVTENVQKTDAGNSIAYGQLESTLGKYLGNFKLTAYCNCAVCCGRWAGGPTASGKMPEQGRTIATGVLPFGTKLNIGGKIYTVEDRGTPYGHIDIYMKNHADAQAFGVRYADVYQSEEI